MATLAVVVVEIALRDDTGVLYSCTGATKKEADSSSLPASLPRFVENCVFHFIS